MFATVKQHLFNLCGIFVMTISVLAIFLFVTIVPNLSLIISLIKSESTTIPDVFKVISELIASAPTSMTLSSITVVLLSGILFGANIVLGNDYKRKIGDISNDLKSKASGLTALILSIFGIGCASCGSILLVNALSFIGASSLLAFLPFGGTELAVLGLVFLLWSNVKLVKALNAPLVC